MLLHDFGVVARAKADYKDRTQWADYHGLVAAMEQRVRIDDDLLQYIHDSLKWISAFNPSRQCEHHGLNLNGVTVVQKTGAQLAAKVFGMWAELFELSPPELLLTGAYVMVEGSDDPGHYEQLHLKRDDVVTALRSLASAFRRVASGDGSEYVLHCGV